VRPLEGVRVIEIASYVFVPVTGAVLADWGAEVIKIEHPVTGDPSRGLRATTQGGAAMAASALFQVLNRGKRSVGLDLSTPEGRSVLYKLVESADVFLTNMLPSVREKHEIDVPHIRAHNPDIIYAKGSGVGPRGAQKNRGGFDLASYWSRGGTAAAFKATHASLEYPPRQLGAFGDLPSGAILAGGIAAALARRALHGVPSIVDTSLLSYALWQQLAEVTRRSEPGGDDPATRRERAPLHGTYATRDEKFVAVSVPDGEAFARFGEALGRPELSTDERFATADSRATNRAALDELLQETFRTRPLEEWTRAFEAADWAWDPVQTVFDLVNDPQFTANEYVVTARSEEGLSPQVALAPVQFDQQSPSVRVGPNHGEDTDAVLLDLGYDWEQLIELKISGGVL
jgi:crotonobetainyl-CoA:carnitine CoA-transferase CaiB-like acyl-CoA transferase